MISWIKKQLGHSEDVTLADVEQQARKLTRARDNLERQVRIMDKTRGSLNDAIDEAMATWERSARE